MMIILELLNLLLLLFCFDFETRFLYIALTVLELSSQTKLSSNSENSACFSSQVLVLKT